MSKWDQERIVYIPVQHVRMLIEFDSFEDWKKGKKKLWYFGKNNESIQVTFSGMVNGR